MSTRQQEQFCLYVTTLQMGTSELLFEPGFAFNIIDVFFFSLR